MKITKLIATVFFASLFLLNAQCETDSMSSMEVCLIQTNHGEMQFSFYEAAAPLTVANFKKLVNEGFYDSLTFYRVVKDHVIQAGDGGESGHPTVNAEFNVYPHRVGTVGLARSQDPNSGSTEFYICHIPRPHLDGKYTVFGQLLTGYDTLENIANVEIVEQFVGDENNIAFHGPKEPVIIVKATIETINHSVK